ncbi:MAG: tRNA pseudouridine(55) synthase TruB [Candidatus Sericytochromatia bacterium]|nr:tRNA pseudouridine(55) synthase TruB [Candidatus Sericytochromatia bacterium]
MSELKGWLNLNKEKGITSHDLVSKVRKKLKIKRVGHAGTLDPMATGVMVIAVGQATRLIQFLQETKTYKAEVYLGITTDTLDAEGKILSENQVNVTQEQIHQAIKKYIGKIKQIPPMVSAIHHEGVRLYELARQGIEVERKSRDIEIYNITISEINLPKFTIEVSCQSGTYIRTLADDIGRDLGCGAHLSKLERTEANKIFARQNSLEVDDITPETLIPFDLPVRYLPEISLDDELAKKYLQGQKINITNKNDTYRVTNNNSLIGIAKLNDNLLKPEVNFVFTDKN